MRIDKVVVNSSPIIVLFKSHFEEILPSLFKEIIIPNPVYKEITHHSKTDRASIEMPMVDWYKNINVKMDEQVLAWGLGNGESAVLSFALSNLDFRAIVDDKAARKFARTYKIKTLGTGSILVLAKKRGLISSLSDAINKVRDSGLYISDNVKNQLVKQQVKG
jgi:predicted nucleic acid-binding protein